MKGKNALFIEAPIGVWVLLIYVASSIHAVSLPTSILGFDKAIHFSIFFVLGALIVRAFHLRGLLEHSPIWYTLTASLLAALYGVFDEIHQGYVPGRSVDYWDAVADAVGGIAGSITAFKARRILR